MIPAMEARSEHDAAISRVVRTLEARLRPVAILLYGSAARGRNHRRSDIDIAVLCGDAVPSWDDAQRLALALADVAGREVDLAFLDKASPILAMEALRTGELLACSDREQYESFVVRTATAYEDLKIVRRSAEARLLGTANV